MQPSYPNQPIPQSPRRNPWFWFRRQRRFAQLGIGCGSLTAALLLCIAFGGILEATGHGAPTPTPGSQGAAIAQPTSTPTAAVSLPTSAPTAAAQPTARPTPTATSRTAPTPTATQAPFLPESLALSGDVSGSITKGINPRPLTHDNPDPPYVQQPDGSYFAPAPPYTQCSDFDVSGVGRDYVAVIVGTIGTLRYTIAVEINEDDPAYASPGTPLHPGTANTGGSVQVYETGGQSRRWIQVYGPAGQDATIVLHADRVSGTVDAWMATEDQSQKTATETLHLHGSWRCG
jgi:hypothetical protein